MSNKEQFKKILDTHVGTEPFSVDIVNRADEYGKRSRDTGIDSELRTAFFDEFGFTVLSVAYDDEGKMRSTCGTLAGFFQGKIVDYTGNASAFAFLCANPGTRVVIATVTDSGDVNSTRILLERVSRNRYLGVLGMFVVASDPELRQAIIDSGFDAYPDENSLVDAFRVRVFGRSGVCV